MRFEKGGQAQSRSAFLSRRTPDTTEVTTEVMTAPARQDRNPPVVMGMPSDVDSQPVRANRRESVTSANRPNIRRYRGNASILTTGLIIEFTSVNTKAMTARAMTLSDAVVDVMEIDGTRRVAVSYGRSPSVVCREISRRQRLTPGTGVEVFFTHPHSPWERGTNENTNRLIRRYRPKGTPTTSHQPYLDAIAYEPGNCPRATLDYRTPTKAFNQLIATTHRHRPQRLNIVALLTPAATRTRRDADIACSGHLE